MRHGVQIFFYAHDHVFTDMVVDGIHYTLPGSAGAPWKFAESETGYKTLLARFRIWSRQRRPGQRQVDFVAMGGGVIASYTLP